MIKPKVHPREKERLAALFQLDILDSEPDPQFDEIVNYLKQEFQVPISLVSLVDESRQWFKAKTGLDVSETGRDISFCGHAIHDSELFEVEDASLDPRFSDNPLVTGAPDIRFYAGQPITTSDGLPIGTLCVIDNKPRQLTAPQRALLKLLADQIMRLMIARKQAKLLQLKTQALSIEKQMLESISRIQQDFIRGANNYEMFSEFLNALLKLTDSEYGFIGEVLTNENNQRYLKTHAITDISWNDETSSWYQQNAPAGLEFTNLSTLFGKVIKEAKVLIANDAPHHAAAGGIPDGHPPLNRFIGIPFKKGEDMIGMIGLANRPEGYSDGLVEVLKPVIDTCTQLILANRAQNEKIDQEQRIEEEKQRNRDQAAQFKVIYNSLHDGVISVKADTGIILDVNDAFAAMLGYDTDEIIGKTVDDISVDKSLFYSVLGSFRDDVNHRNVVSYEKEYIHKSGKLVSVSVTSYYSPSSDTNEEILWALVKDITKFKEEEAQRLQEQKMNSLGTLSGGIAHDFNNILGIVLTNAEMIEMVAPDEKIQKRVQTIQKASQRGAELVSRILEFSRKKSHERAPSCAKGLVEHALELISNITPNSITMNTDINDVGYIMSNQNDVSQILMNLVSNAIHAIESNVGEITVCLRFDEDNGQVLMSVQDTGLGMDEETKKQIFDPFFTTKHQHNGTGLGLAIVYSIVNELNGHIELHSEEGEGTLFKIWLPPCQSVVTTNDKDTGEVNRNTQKRILLIEDEPMLLNVFKEALEIYGHEVLAFACGVDLLDYLSQTESKNFQILITDDEMPKMRGVELISQVKEHLPEINTILVTGNVSDKAQQMLANNELDHLVEKPASLEKLMKLVEAS